MSSRKELSKEEKKKRIEIVCKYEGILPHNEAFYIHSIIYCATRAEEAFLRYDVYLADQSSDVMVVSAIHEALSHVASLSRFFWPSWTKKIHKERARKLRSVFCIGDDSSLKNRDLRDALEHFDERLDIYLLQQDAGHFFPQAIVGDHRLADEPTANFFKLVDPSRNVFVILNEKFDFSKVRMEVGKIQQLAEQFDENGSRFTL